MNKCVCLMLIIVTVIFNATAYSIDTAKKMNEAEAYYEAQEYELANNIYQQLLQENIPAWMRAILLYNIGRIMLAQEDWDHAIVTLSTVPVNDAPPLLRYSVAHNLIFAYLGKARSLKESSPQEARNALKEALVILPALDPAHCAIEKAEGRQQCTSVPDLDKLQSYIQQQLALSLKTAQKASIDKVDFQEGLKWLQQGVDDALKHLDFLEQPQLQDPLKQQYNDLFVSDSEQWNPLWDSLEGKIPTEKDNKRETLFATAKEQFKQGIDTMKDNDLKSSRTAFEESSKAIKALLAMPPPPAQQAPQGTPQSEIPKVSENIKVLQLLEQMSQQDMMPLQAPTIRQEEKMPW